MVDGGTLSRRMSTSTLLDLHGTFAWVLVGINAAAGVWALGAHRVERLRGTALWIFTGVAWATIVIEVVLGALLSNRDIEAPEFHEFYGFVALIAAALIYSYRAQIKEQQYLLFGLGNLFIMGLGLRAIHLA